MNKGFKSFAKITGSSALLLIMLGGYPLYHVYGLKIIAGFLIALTLTFLNAVVGYYYIDKYFSASFNEFMKKVFGSMGVRLLVLGLVFAGLIGFTKIHEVSFTVSLFISYILFSVIEIYYLNKKASKPET